LALRYASPSFFVSDTPVAQAGVSGITALLAGTPDAEEIGLADRETKDQAPMPT
jgi:hypothetical protein